MLKYQYDEKTNITVRKMATGETITMHRKIEGCSIVYEIEGGTIEDMKKIAHDMEQAFIETMLP